MSGPELGGALCALVLDRLVDGADVDAEPVLAEHLGSCVICFRALGELRDAPRVVEALRAAEEGNPPVLPDRLWEALAARTEAAIGAEASGPQRPTWRRDRPGTVERARRGRSLTRGARAGVVAAAMLVAAAWALAPRGVAPWRSRDAAAPAAMPASVSAGSARGRPAAEQARAGEGAEAATIMNDEIADLDGEALRRVLDRLGAQASTRLASFGGENENGDGDALDDDPRVNDEIADLDGPELRRVASSLSEGAW